MGEGVLGFSMGLLPGESGNAPGPGHECDLQKISIQSVAIPFALWFNM